MSFFHKNTMIAFGFLVVSFCWITYGAPDSARAEAALPSANLRASKTLTHWVFPVSSQVVLEDFWAPNGDFSAGHRGVDFAATEGESVMAVADGTIRFAGPVAGRNLLSLQTDSGLVAEVEPVCATVSKGDSVTAGQALGVICSSNHIGHCAISCVHLSARNFSQSYARGFAYFNPLLFLNRYQPSHLVAIGTLR